jgi:hypothetical protein
MSHTPGPWEVGLDPDGELAIVTAEARDICTVEKYYEDYEGNAQLIAAAPNMLKALDRARLLLQRAATRIRVFSHLSNPKATDTLAEEIETFLENS